jgi:hypothetical protein
VQEFGRSMADYPIKVNQFNRIHANEPFNHLKAKHLDTARKTGNLQKTGVEVAPLAWNDQKNRKMTL